MKPERIERLLKLVQLLQSGLARTARQLAARAGVSPRTVYRDLDLLAQAGIPYEFDRKHQRYSVEGVALLPPISLTRAEALSLMLMTRHRLGVHLVPDQAAALSGVLKIEGILPPALQDYCGPLLELIEVRHEPVSDSASVGALLASLQSALTERRKIRVQYESDSDARKLDLVLHPYRLAYVYRAWYLIALAEETSNVHAYEVERFSDLKLLPAHCRVDPSFNLNDYFGNAWLMTRGHHRYHVRIRFEPAVAGDVEDITWHRTQRTTREDGGSLLFEADVDGVEEISAWVLGYGDRAEVLEPPELRDLLAHHARRMCAYYDDLV